VLALDGEREIEIKKGQQASIRLATDGPLVVDVDRIMAFAGRIQNRLGSLIPMAIFVVTLITLQWQLEMLRDMVFPPPC
jgi:hypothetical protein